MKLVFASNNKNKILEVQNMLPSTIKIVSLESIGCMEDIPETADTIEENAIMKANYITQKYGYDCFADDTGLEVEALNGAPGVYSARYAGVQPSAEDNMNKLLGNLKDETNRNAQFKTYSDHYSGLLVPWQLFLLNHSQLLRLPLTHLVLRP